MYIVEFKSVNNPESNWDRLHVLDMMEEAQEFIIASLADDIKCGYNFEYRITHNGEIVSPNMYRKDDILTRLEESANWLERNASFHFDEDQNHYSFNQKKDAVKAMRDALSLLENLGVGKKIFGGN